MTKQDPVIIVGGGLGGAAAALALGRQGFRVRVLEQAPEFGVIGYGIQLGPNVFPMFERLGVTDAVMAHAMVPKALLMLDCVDGGVIAKIPTGPSFRARFGAPYVVIHRVDLHRVLLDACAALDTVELIPSWPVARFEDHGGHVRAVAQDGRFMDGAALIAADGLHSAIRAQMYDEGEPRMVGYVAHRTIVPMDAVTAEIYRDEVVLWSGPGFHIVHYPLRDGTLFNIVAVFRTETFAQRADTARYHAEIERTYARSHPAMKSLLALMNLERRWPISDRDPIRRRSAGRVTLLGDAAHPTLQSLAQGACMAIEDAVSLAAFVGEDGGAFESAFRRYEQARALRTARVQFESRHLWDHCYHVDGIERDVVRDAFAKRGEAGMFDCVAWLYDGITLPGWGNAA